MLEMIWKINISLYIPKIFEIKQNDHRLEVLMHDIIFVRGKVRTNISF